MGEEMNLEIKRVGYPLIESLRAMFLTENHCQIRFDAVHRRGWADEYLLILDGCTVGYGSIKGLRETDDRDSIFEWYLRPETRFASDKIFQRLIDVTAAKYIVAQTNQPQLSGLQARHASSLSSEALLFGNPIIKQESAPSGCRFRKIELRDNPLFAHRAEPEGTFGIERNGVIVATAGYLQHYNFPFVDLYLEVRDDCRGRGIGRYLIQELIKYCFLVGRIPAARCNPANLASKKCLLCGGFKQVGSILIGQLAVRPESNQNDSVETGLKTPDDLTS
jgi:ribosomal protein S18 acetylase RimI-like enzyme